MSPVPFLAAVEGVVDEAVVKRLIADTGGIPGAEYGKKGRMCFRVAVRETEAWLMADCERLAQFLGVRRSWIPGDPEAVDDPKTTLVDLARRSRRRDIREDMVPRAGSGRSVGPAYNSRLIEFATDRLRGWRPDVAAAGADSLARCRRCIDDLMRRWETRN